MQVKITKTAIRDGKRSSVPVGREQTGRLIVPEYDMQGAILAEDATSLSDIKGRMGILVYEDEKLFVKTSMIEQVNELSNTKVEVITETSTYVVESLED